MKRPVLNAALGFVLLSEAAWGQDSENPFAARAARIDEQFVGVLKDLARQYDKDNPEAAHFFLECLLGLGEKSSASAARKRVLESEFLVGKLRGGDVRRDVTPVLQALKGPATEYEALFGELYKATLKTPRSEPLVKLLHECAIKFELSRGAADYILMIQELNKLRRGMGLRCVLWEFEASSRLILAGCYMGETADLRPEGVLGRQATTAQKDHPFWGAAVDFGKNESTRVPESLGGFIDRIRASAIGREDLFNMDARRVWLGGWTGGAKIRDLVLYAFPSGSFREDVPTPSQRYLRETRPEAWPEWEDTELTAKVNGRTIPFAHYPYEDEPDAPISLKAEHGWAESEKKFLAKAGSAVMFRFMKDCAVTEVEFRLKDAAGKVVPSRLYRDGDARIQFQYSLPTFLLLPERHLQSRHKYGVSLRCKVEGVPFERSWAFTTR